VGRETNLLDETLLDFNFTFLFIFYTFIEQTVFIFLPQTSQKHTAPFSVRKQNSISHNLCSYFQTLAKKCVLPYVSVPVCMFLLKVVSKNQALLGGDKSNTPTILAHQTKKES